MKVGIKFCGGCNPKYDRGEYLKHLVKAHKEWDYEMANVGTRYDLLVVIGGCTACCATYNIYTYDEISFHHSEKQEEVWNN